MDRRDVILEVMENDDIEQCRNLCNELMSYQYSQSVEYRNIFMGMSFDTRLKPSYEKAKNKLVVIAKNDILPIGYLYVTIDELRQEDITPSRTVMPSWVQCLYSEEEDIQGSYPRWLAPQTVGHIENLYIKPEYRKHGIGKEFMVAALDVFKKTTDLNYAFVHVSNGNNRAADFYKKFGFQFSHEVFKGFITAYIKEFQ